MQWFYGKDKQTHGPVTEDDIVRLICEGQLGRDNLVWNEKSGNQWVPVSQMPKLAAFLPQEGAGKVSASELQRRKEEGEAARKKEKKTSMMITGAVVLVLAVAISIPIYLKVTAPKRERGISSSNPIGRFDKLDRHFREVFQMDRAEVPSCPGVARSAQKIYAYTNPKAPRGANVSGDGTIYLFVDGDRLVRLCVMFTSSGPRGGIIYNDSVAGLWAQETWFVIEPKKPVERQNASAWPQGTYEKTGVADDLPKNGELAIHDSKKVNGCWYECGSHGIRAIIHFELK